MYVSHPRLYPLGSELYIFQRFNSTFVSYDPTIHKIDPKIWSTVKQRIKHSRNWPQGLTTELTKSWYRYFSGTCQCLLQAPQFLEEFNGFLRTSNSCLSVCISTCLTGQNISVSRMLRGIAAPLIITEVNLHILYICSSSFNVCTVMAHSK